MNASFLGGRGVGRKIRGGGGLNRKNLQISDLQRLASLPLYKSEVYVLSSRKPFFTIHLLRKPWPLT